MWSTLLKTGGKAAVMFLVRRYAASLLFDYFIEQAAKLAKRTDTQIDDEAVAALKADKADFIAALKGRI